MTAAGTIGAAEFLSGGTPINLSALQGRLGGSAEGINQRVQLLERVCGTPITRTKTRARRYTSNIADVLAEAQHDQTGQTFEEALRTALLRRGVHLEIPDVPVSPDELHEGLLILHDRVCHLEAGASEALTRAELEQQLANVTARLDSLTEQQALVHAVLRRHQGTLASLNRPWPERCRLWWRRRRQQLQALLCRLLRRESQQT